MRHTLRNRLTIGKVDNQMEENMENAIETGVMGGYNGVCIG